MAKGFRIAARALRQLGAELITTDEIALNELIKNAFDARSKRVVIKIDSPFTISKDALIKISTTWPTTPVAAKDKLTKYICSNILNDIYQNILECFTKHHSQSTKEALEEVIDSYCSVVIEDQGVGMSPDDLKNAFLVVGTPTKWLTKKNNQSDDILLGEKGVGRLSMMRLGRYAILHSGILGSTTYSKIDFDWQEFDDPEKYLDEIEVEVIESSRRKDIDTSGTTIEIYGLNSYWSLYKAKKFVELYLRRLQNPFDTKTRRFPVDVIFNGERIDIPRMYPWFKKCANFSAQIDFFPESLESNQPLLIRKLQWYGKDSSETRSWGREELINQLQCNDDDISKLGKFTINCLWYNRAGLNTDEIDQSPNEVKEELNLWCGGYAIYRDSFRVGVTGGLEDDWLMMDRKTLTSKGFTFNRYQTVGAIAISQKKNPFFVDAANRERLVDCHELELLKDIVKIINDDLKSHVEVIRSAEIKSAISEASTTDAIKNSKENLRKTIKAINQVKKYIPENQRYEVVEIEKSIKTHLEDVRRLEKAVDLAKEQRIEILELAGMGMVVDKVIHELARLTESITDNLNKLERAGGSASEAISTIKIIKEQVRATNKRIRSVDRLSPSGRNRKELFDLTSFVGGILMGYKGRFDRHNIKARLLVDDLDCKSPFMVNMVSGFVAQIIENLLNNSLYWLSVSLKENDTEAYIEVNLDTKSKTISISDNGPGVAPEYAIDIFRPYHTTRPNGKGLGLFIANELANYHQATLYLDTNADEDGRLRCFVIELPNGV